jgi:hypothetical protein
MNGTPREEEAIVAEITKAENEVRALEGAGAGFPELRERLTAALEAAEAAYRDSATTFEKPDWASAPGMLERSGIDRIQTLRRALEELAAAEREAPGSISRELDAASEGLVDLFACVRRDDDRLELLWARLAELSAELADRQAGPGKPKPYTLLRGSHGTG